MAFEQPLEADRVDDLNFFGAFVRAPIIGSLMWILGGQQAQESEQDESSETNIMKGTVKCRKSALKKSAPSLAGSEISDVGECDPDGGGLLISQTTLLRSGKKQLSWSDESGKSLVEIIAAESFPVHHHQHLSKSASDAPSTTSTAGSSGQSLQRTRSVRGQMESPNGDHKSYLPRGLDRSRRQREAAAAAAAEKAKAVPPSGVESPLWGWYITTTPPTPEMYHSRPPLTSQPPITYNPNVSQTKPNLVFQGLQDQNKGATAFPTVPL